MAAFSGDLHDSFMHTSGMQTLHTGVVLISGVEGYAISGAFLGETKRPNSLRQGRVFFQGVCSILGAGVSFQSSAKSD